MRKSLQNITKPKVRKRGAEQIQLHNDCLLDKNSEKGEFEGLFAYIQKKDEQVTIRHLLVFSEYLLCFAAVTCPKERRQFFRV